MRRSKLGLTLTALLLAGAPLAAQGGRIPAPARDRKSVV